MGAWRLRACVYGMLAVVAALVIVQTRARADEAPTAGPPPAGSSA